MTKETRIVKHDDDTATIYTKNIQDGKVYYYAQEIADGWQGDVYDITHNEWIEAWNAEYDAS